MMLRSVINITHIPEEQVAYRQCTRPSLPPAKAWLREANHRAVFRSDGDEKAVAATGSRRSTCRGVALPSTLSESESRRLDRRAIW